MMNSDFSPVEGLITIVGIFLLVILCGLVQFIISNLGLVLLVTVLLTLFGIAFQTLCKHPRETLLTLTAPIWLSHMIPAWLLLWTVRNRSVRDVIVANGWQNIALTTWLWLIPAGVVSLWATGLAIYLSFPFWIELALIVGSTGLFVGCYYWVYFQLTPQDDGWRQFIRLEKERYANFLLGNLERRAYLQALWRSLWS